MSYSYEDRLSDSPYVRTIWHTYSESHGCYMAAADESWDMLVIKQKGKARLVIAGPATKSAPIIYEAGMEYLGIRFAIGSFLPHLPCAHILDEVMVLPRATSRSFWLDDAVLPLPDYDNVEMLVDRLVRGRLLAHDPVVTATLEGDPRALSWRSVQRHFMRATGLTPIGMRQIERARQATALLRQGVPILDAVAAAGYADQPHMTRAMKRFMGQTPTQIARTHRP